MRLKVQGTLLAAAALVVAACGGGGGASDGAGSSSSPPPGASKTVFVSGVIDGFGSVIVNGVHYDTSGTAVSIDDEPGSTSELRVGHVVRMEAEVDSRGAAHARSIDQEHLLAGTVQAVDVVAGTLTVAGQLVRVDGETSFDDSVPGGSLDGVAVGARVEVHGFVGADGAARATRIEHAQAGETEVEVTGLVAALDTAGKRMRVGSLTVDYATATFEDFGDTGLREGDLVEVEGREFLADGALRATSVEREDGGIRGVSGSAAEIEGYVTRFVSPADFDVAGQRVTTTSAAVYENGTSAELRLDARVEAEGRLDANGVLVAGKIEFKLQPSLRIAAAIEAVDPAASTLRVLGVTVVVNAATRKEDKVGDDPQFGLGDLHTGDWVELHGYADPVVPDRVIATLLERDEPEDEVELRGRAEDLQAPRFRILGVDIETTPATEFEDEDVRIDAATFFARAAGQLVEVDGQWNGASLIADAAEIEREEGAVAPPPTTPPPPAPPPPVPPPSSLDGAALYSTHCSGCHGPINAIVRMPVSNRTAADFRRAIDGNKGGMGFLDSLTDAELQAIADAIRAANP